MPPRILIDATLAAFAAARHNDIGLMNAKRHLRHHGWDGGPLCDPNVLADTVACQTANDQARAALAAGEPITEDCDE